MRSQQCSTLSSDSSERFGGVTVGRQTYDQEVVGSTPGRVAINWLLWVTVCGQVNHLDI